MCQHCVVYTDSEVAFGRITNDVVHIAVRVLMPADTLLAVQLLSCMLQLLG